MKPRQEHIVNTSIKLFNQHGYFKTTMSDINRAAGVSKGVFYHYFPDGKKELMRYVLRMTLAQQRELEEKLFSENETKDAVHQLIRTLRQELINGDDTSVHVGMVILEMMEDRVLDDETIETCQGIFELTEQSVKQSLMAEGVAEQLALQKSQLLNLSLKGALSIGIKSLVIDYLDLVDATVDTILSGS